MRWLAAAFLAGVAVLALATLAQADPSEYGIESVTAAASDSQAGAHPDLEIALRLKKDVSGGLPSTTRDFFVDLPPGLLGNPNALPKCSAVQLVSTDINNPSNETGCPQASQVGVVEVALVDKFNQVLQPLFEPIYNMEPRAGAPARLGFFAQIFPVFVDARLRSEGPNPDYGVSAMIEGSPSLVSVLAASNSIWGAPALEAHDAQRITPYEAIHNNGSPETLTGKRTAGLAPVPFVANPTRCAVTQGVGITAVPYALPTLEFKAFAPMKPNSGCGALGFEPMMALDPTTDWAGGGSGLEVKLGFPTKGLEDPDLYLEATQKRVEVTLPEGMTVNPSQAAGGLGACSPAEASRETATSTPGAGCPEAAKVGSAIARTPLLDEPVEGSLYVAKPYDNPFGSLLALYMVFKVPDRGVIVTLPAKVDLDPETGQLVTTVDEIPQLPVSEFQLSFRGGPRSPLVTPPTCGVHQATAIFTSWADPTHPVTLHPAFEIDRGVDGAPCPSGAPPFRPGFEAGAVDDTAGKFTPYRLRFTREDGDQNLSRFSVTFPPGAVAKLAGVGRCSDAAIEAAKGRSGLEEQANPSCPLGSEVGHVLGGAGVGEVLTYAEGRLYLASPYNGAQLSTVAIVPAVAGPFDLGTIVTRQALTLDPKTGRAQVDGARSDPLPRILAGIPLRVRDVRADVDRPGFTLNPTSCDPLAFAAQLWGAGSDPLSLADDASASLSARFQVANCALLGFKPKLSLRFNGGTRRGAFPALRAVVRPRKGDANIGFARVTLPRSAFVEQSHFRTICTRVQFAAERCPPGSVYGRVRAFSPLLDEPLEGPVYLRSSNNPLPDLVFALSGIVDIDVIGRVDSFKGRLRTTFADVPDAPVSKVVVTMQGGEKGLFVNSTALCRARQHAQARLRGQNAKRRNFNPVARNSCGRKTKAQKRHR
jgi:hypothetical protein